MSNPVPDPVIREQIEYYRARAAEYDDWWLRRGKYDAGPDFALRWSQEIAHAHRWLVQRQPRGRILEIAAGTGNWSTLLEPMATQLTVMDSSPEALEICRDKLTRASTEVVVADVFAWDPPVRYDTVVFTFWLSHVTRAAWDLFWQKVEAMLAPGGRLMMIESLDPSGRSPSIPDAYRQLGAQDTAGTDPEMRVRTTADGRSFRVAKRYWTPASLVSELNILGWDIEAQQTDFAFLCAVGVKR